MRDGRGTDVPDLDPTPSPCFLQEYDSMGVRWWGCAKDTILKRIAEIGHLQGEGRWAAGAKWVRERIFINTPTGPGQPRFTENAEKERGKDESAGECRQSCERDIGHGSSGSNFVSIYFHVYLMLIRTGGVDSNASGGSGRIRRSWRSV